MTAYIKRIISEILGLINEAGTPKRISLMRALAEEMNRLDPTDFLPHARYDFVENRSTYSWYVEHERFVGDEITHLLNNLLHILDSYGGQGSQAVLRSFDFIVDPQLRTIVERDYRELHLILFPSEAWKSCVIMSGSILEAILHDQLTSDPGTKANAMASSRAPKHKTGAVKDIDAGEWTLHNLIEVSVDLEILPEQRSKTVDQVLRDYRNFVHPSKERRAQHACGEAEGLMSKGALDGVCNHLTTKMKT